MPTAVRPALATVLASLALPAAAHAAVTITPDRIVVTGDGAGAVITRAPLRIAFTDAGGRVVLQEAAAPVPLAPAAVLPVPGPVPLGQDVVRRPALYAPLTFTVGAQGFVQIPGSQFAGDLVTGAAAGVTYAGTAVTAAAAEGDGVRLTVATNDPTGRTLAVVLTPGPHHAIRVGVRPSSTAGVAAMADSFTATSTEAFRGFGGRHNALDQRGEDFLSYNQQENVGSGALGPIATATDPARGDRLLFPNGRTAAYYSQAEFLSSGGYGFLLDRPELARWRMAVDRPDAWQAEVAAAGLDYLVFPGDARAAMADLTAVTGRHRVPPAWAAGTIFDRATRYPGDNAKSYLADVEQDLRDIDRYQLPLDAYRIEGWQFLTRPQVRDIIARLHARGIRALLYFRAFVGSETNVGTDDPRAYAEALAKGYVATRADGSPYVFVSNFNAPGALVDFTNPAAVAWWKQRITEGLDLGADGFMQDFGEQAMVDMHFHDGSTGAELHNRYPLLFHRATREAVDAWEAAHPRHDKIWFFTRTGYSGTPGSAADEGGTFAGDGTTDFSRSSGLAAQAPDMLNRAIGGAYGFTTDIGGYFDVALYPKTTKELFLRWAEWAALSPFFRLHGSVVAGTHTPWSYDAETVRLYNGLSRLRRRAVPYLLRTWRTAVRTGLPVTRPLWLVEPGSAEAARQDQEWLLGDDVLVAPVVTQGATARSVFFPSGCWRSPESGLTVTGPRSQSVPAALDVLPYFFRCGTTPFPAVDTGAAALPKACTSRRRFTIHLRDPRGPERLASARILVNGRTVRTLKARGTRRLTARIDLRGLPKGRVTVRVVARTTRGRTLVETRTYRTCAAHQAARPASA